MLAGHYGVALALKKVNKKLNIGWIFLATMLPDILLGIFVLTGAEKVYIPSNYEETHYLVFEFPYSHGLVSTLIWTAIIFVSIRFHKRAAATLAIAFFSHFLLDVIVHIPEIPLFDNTSYKIGLGLWNHYPAALALELLITVIGLTIYLKEKRTMKSKVGISIVTCLLMIFTSMQPFSPTPSVDFINVIAIQWIVSGIGISLLAFWLDHDSSILY